MRKRGQVVLDRKALLLQAEEVGVAGPERSEFHGDKCLLLNRRRSHQVFSKNTANKAMGAAADHRR